MFCRIPLCCWFFEFEESKVRSVWLIAGQETFSLRPCNDNLKGQPYHRVFGEDIETDSALWTEVYCRIFRGKMDVAIRNVCVFSKLSKNERFIFSPVFFLPGFRVDFLWSENVLIVTRMLVWMRSSVWVAAIEDFINVRFCNKTITNIQICDITCNYVPTFTCEWNNCSTNIVDANVDWILVEFNYVRHLDWFTNICISSSKMFLIQ